VTLQERIAAGIQAAAAALLIAATALIAAQIILRGLFNAPMAWVEEVVRYAFVWCVYLGGVLALIRNSHIRVMVVVDALGPSARRISDALTWLVNVVCFAYLLYWGADLAWKYRSAEFYTLPGIPQIIFYLAVPVSMAIMLAFLLVPRASAVKGGGMDAET
jgi:TRAP-type C4-dicarboxylate transport system permease small subunit